MVADRFGRRRLLLIALAAFSLLGLMPLLFNSLGAIIASRVVVGLAEASILVCCNALWGDYFGDDERKKWLSVQQTSGPVFSALLAFAGGALAAWHWNFSFWLYALGIPPLVLVVLFAWEPARRQPLKVIARPGATRFPWRVAAMIASATLGVSLVFFVLALQMGRVFAALGVTSAATNGALIMAASSGGILGGILFGLLRKSSILRLLALGLVAYGFGYVGMSQSIHPAAGTAFSFVAQVGSSIVLPSLIVWTLGSFPVEHRGRGIGIWGATFFMGQFLSAPVLTLLEQWRGSLLAALGVVGVITLVVAATLWWASRRSTDVPSEVVS